MLYEPATLAAIDLFDEEESSGRKMTVVKVLSSSDCLGDERLS